MHRFFKKLIALVVILGLWISCISSARIILATEHNLSLLEPTHNSFLYAGEEFVKSSNISTKSIVSPSRSSYYYETNLGSFIVFDKNENIIEFNRIEAVISMYSNVYSYSYQQLLNDIQNIIMPNYKKRGECLFDENTLYIRYEKELYPNIFDTYDFYSLYIDKRSNQLLYLYKSEPSFVKEKGTVLSEKQANEYLKTYVSKQEWLGSFDKYEIKTVKANSFFFDNKDNGNIVLAFCFYNDNYLVYVNAYNGDIIGGDIFKTTRGGAIGTPDIYTSSQSISLAKNKLISLGYSDVIEMNSYYLVGATTYMKEAFYACCHGTSTVLSSIAGNNIPTQYQCSYTSVPTGTHKFVFLDACNTASTNWSTAFGITSGSIGKAFIGWAQSVPAGNTLDFCTYFWPLLNGYNSVWVAAIQACALEGSGLSLWFIGDQTYNGYY